MSKKVRSSDAHSWNGGDDPSHGVGVGRRGCDTVSMLMSDDMMFPSVRVINSDEVRFNVVDVRHVSVDADVVVVDVVSCQVFDVVVLLDLDVQVLRLLDVEPLILLDVDVICVSSFLLLDVDGLLLSMAAAAAV